MAKQREHPIFSACGLNCGLCPRFYTEGISRCPGCGGAGFAEVHPPCGIFSCQERHGGIEFCFQCAEYPCDKTKKAGCVDSFITHQVMHRDLEKARQQGLDTYLSELHQKMAFLQILLTQYNDGRRKSLYCLAVNLLPMEDIRAVLEALKKEDPAQDAKEKAKWAVSLLTEKAAARGVELVLRKKM